VPFGLTVSYADSHVVRYIKADIAAHQPSAAISGEIVLPLSVNIRKPLSTIHSSWTATAKEIAIHNGPLWVALKSALYIGQSLQAAAVIVGQHDLGMDSRIIQINLEKVVVVTAQRLNRIAEWKEVSHNSGLLL
jgi:hypothetical protein